MYFVHGAVWLDRRDVQSEHNSCSSVARRRTAGRSGGFTLAKSGHSGVAHLNNCCRDIDPLGITISFPRNIGCMRLQCLLEHSSFHAEASMIPQCDTVQSDGSISKQAILQYCVSNSSYDLAADLLAIGCLAAR
jgi:hypothetical protein